MYKSQPKHWIQDICKLTNKLKMLFEDFKIQTIVDNSFQVWNVFFTSISVILMWSIWLKHIFIR